MWPCDGLRGLAACRPLKVSCLCWWGETQSSRRTAWMCVAVPRQVVQHTLILPFFSPLNEPGPNRIGSHAFPFVMVILVAAEPMMKTAWLKTRRGWADLAPKLPFPESDPLLDRDFFILWRAEKVHVIRHYHVGADQPCVSLSSRLHESIMVGLLCECCWSTQCANSQEDDRWTIPRNQDASSRVAPAWVMPNVNLRHPRDDFRSNVVRRALFVGSTESRPTSTSGRTGDRRTCASSDARLRLRPRVFVFLLMSTRSV